MEKFVTQKTKIGGIIQNDQLASISVLAVKDRPGIAAAVLDALGQRNINVQFVVQVIDQSDQAQMVLCVDRMDLKASLDAIETIRPDLQPAAVAPRSRFSGLIFVNDRASPVRCFVRSPAGA